MILVGILGIVAAVIAVTIDPLGEFTKSNDEKRRSDLMEMKTALENYYEDNNAYPRSGNDGTIKDIKWGNGWSPYLNRVPRDPRSPEREYYYYSDIKDRNQSYVISASLEGQADSFYCNGGETCTSLPSGAKCGTEEDAICNFGLSSPNISP